MPLDALRPLAGLDDVDFVNLQQEPAARQLSGVLPRVIDVMQAPLSLDEFAAALAATDAVVSVDTMAAHCAGALGHPVLVALPTVAAWYWGSNERADCAWYPGARLFRRNSGADWSYLVEAIAATLRRDGRRLIINGDVEPVSMR
jgi:hypothetical protein